MLSNNVDIYNLDRIYCTEYHYSLPKKVLEGFMSGKAFDYPKPYTDEEAAKLQADIANIYKSILAKNPTREPVAIMTAGAPGAGKTTKMRQDMESERTRKYAYICPDDVCLKQQEQTYVAEVNSCDGSKEARQAAYNKWRPGSNAANHLILANLIRDKYAFYFGTTSTGPATAFFFKFLKEQGYKIRLMHVSAPDNVRWESIKERDKTFVQTTEQDVVEKGLLLPQRITDTYLEFADEIEFYYRDGVKDDARLAATWIRNPAGSPHKGTLKVVSGPAYEQIKAIHNAGIRQLNKPELSWELTVEKQSLTQ